MTLPLSSSIALILFLAFVLIKSTNLVISAIHALAKQTKIKTYGLAAFLVALSTSFPELIVAVSSGIEQQSTLSLGNVVGSNIANISLILGLAALFGGAVKASDKFIKQQVFYAFLIGTIPALLLTDGSLTRFESLGLVMLYLVYILTTFTQKKRPQKHHISQTHWRRMLTTIADTKIEKSLSLFIVGMAGMVLAANAMVRLSVHVAQLAHVPVFLIGLLVVAVGTSLPELAFEFVAIKHQETNMAFGSILGSIAANSTLILGITGLITPIKLTAGYRPYLISVIGFVVVFGLFWRFVWTKHRLDRWEGLALACVYAVFAIIQFMLAS